MNKRKLLQKLVSGSKDIRFAELMGLLEALGFRLVRISGSHHIFQHPAVQENVNVQDVGGYAKPYQLRQVLTLIEKYNLTLDKE
jgi:predicted RNA binding protein YcfA (HicA-like mRNA interferase family)